MITRLKSNKELPYKLYVSVLLDNKMEGIEEKFEDLEGCLLVTRSPKMTILFVEYTEDGYSKISKKIWDRVQYISENEKKRGKINGEQRKIRQAGKISQQKQIKEPSTVS